MKKEGIRCMRLDLVLSLMMPSLARQMGGLMKIIPNGGGSQTIVSFPGKESDI